MVRGRNNQITRTVGLALAACLTFAGVLTSGDVVAAESDANATADSAKVFKAPVKKAKKRGGKAKQAKVASSGTKPRKSTKGSPTLAASTTQASGGGVVQAKHAAPKARTKSGATTTASAKKPLIGDAEKGKPQASKQHAKGGAKGASPSRAVGTSKKASARAPGAKRKTGKKSDADAERPPCFAPAVSIDRNGLENETFSLVDCKGKPVESAREKLSILARPWGVARPTIEPRKKPKKADKRGSGKDKPTEMAAMDIAPNVRLLDAGLLTRIDAIAKHFPGKHISLVSGYRPRSQGSLHQTARAIDLRVVGVGNEEVVAFCKTIGDTGCGYYPNSSFVHVDVRIPGTGSVTWIDASGPGEAPRYVSTWPPPPEAKAPDADIHDGAMPEPHPLAPSPQGGEGEKPRPQAPSPQGGEGEKPRPEPAKEADPKDPVPSIAHPITSPHPGEGGKPAPSPARTPHPPPPHAD
jgi:hypothetical protein